jgi:hypothetical protein
MPETVEFPTAPTFTDWLSRYNSIRLTSPETPETASGISLFAAIDSWSGQPVRLTAVDIAAHKVTADERRAMFVRARVLQSMDHAHLQPLLDFHLSEEAEAGPLGSKAAIGIRRLCLATDAKCGDELFKSIQTRRLIPLECVSLCCEYVSALCFLEISPPNLVPEIGSQSLFLHKKRSLRICNYQSSYILGKQCSNVFGNIDEFIAKLCTYATPDATIASLKSVVDKGKEQPGVQRLSSLHQVRTALKHFEESLLADSAAKEQ